MLLFIITVVILISLIILGGYLSKYRMKVAINEMVKCFKKQGALDEQNAIKKEKLSGESPRKKFIEFFKSDTEKTYALKLLVDFNVVYVTEDDRFYLSEKELDKSELKNHLT